MRPIRSRTLAAAIALVASLPLLLALGYKLSEPVPVAGADFEARGEKWFRAEEEDARKAQMKEASRALKRPCKYCHTEDFNGFTDKKDITLQMMALSAENDVECKDCHDGRDKLTKMGDEAHEMWELSHEKKVFCDDCHEPKTKFEKLTANGKKQKEEWDAKKKSAAPASLTAPSLPSTSASLPPTRASLPPTSVSTPPGGP